MQIDLQPPSLHQRDSDANYVTEAPRCMLLWWLLTFCKNFKFQLWYFAFCLINFSQAYIIPKLLYLTEQKPLNYLFNISQFTHTQPTRYKMFLELFLHQGCPCFKDDSITLKLSRSGYIRKLLIKRNTKIHCRQTKILPSDQKINLKKYKRFSINHF